MFLKVIIILVILTTVLSQDEPPEEKPPEVKAEDGELCKTNKSESSFMVSLINKNTYTSICVGTLLNGYWVATAGGCVSQKGIEEKIAVLPAHQRITVIVMEDMKKITGSKDANTILYKKFVPELETPTNANFITNIALLRLKKKIELSNLVSYVSFSPKDPLTLTSPRVVVTWKAGEQTGDVYCYKVNIMPMEKCLETLKEYVIPENDDYMCGESVFNTPYMGEIGAPLMGNKNVDGIVCWVNPKKSYIFSKITRLLPIIAKVMEADNGGMEKKVCVYWLFGFTFSITYFFK